jgi:hypothetical protein
VHLKTLPLVVNLFSAWWFLPSGYFINYQHYSKGLTYVQLNVPNRTEKNLHVFWWIYTYLERGVFSRRFLCLLRRKFCNGESFFSAEEKENSFSREFGA